MMRLYLATTMPPDLYYLYTTTAASGVICLHVSNFAPKLPSHLLEHILTEHISLLCCMDTSVNKPYCIGHLYPRIKQVYCVRCYKIFMYHRMVFFFVIKLGAFNPLSLFKKKKFIPLWSQP